MNPLYSLKFCHVLQVSSSISSQTSTPSLFAFVFLPASCFYNMVGVRAIGGHGDVVAMDAELAVVLIQGLQGGHVGSSLDHLIHPLYRSHHAVPDGSIYSVETLRNNVLTYLSSSVKTGGPLCFVISSSVWTPTTSHPPIAFA